MKRNIKMETGGVVRKMYSGDAVLYEGNVWYVTEKDGKLGITNLKSGAWGSKYPFVERSRIDTSKLTDMMGRKVELVESKMAKGGGVDDEKYAIVVYPKGKGFRPHWLKELGLFESRSSAEFQAKQTRKMKDIYDKVEVYEISNMPNQYAKGGGVGSEFEYTIGGL